MVKAEVELPGQPNRNSERTADRDLRHEPRLKADKGAGKGSAKRHAVGVVVRLPGDVNGDGVVDGRDTEIVSLGIGKAARESTCGSACDLNGNGIIDPVDLDLVMMHCDRNYCAAIPVVDGKKTMSPAEKKALKR